tara:strand:- start:5251 stop:5784 length:534 start_codon:yes stop_codon:yes gene_type:complete
MNKLEKRFENIIKKNYNKKDFQNKLVFNFENFEINKLLNNQKYFEYILIKIVKKQNSNDIWIQRVIMLIEALSEGLFKQQQRKGLKLEVLLKKVNLDSMINLYLDLKEKNINSEKLFDYLLYLPGFLLDENKNIPNKIPETVYENHGYLIMHLTESICGLIEEIKNIEEKRKKIKNF